MGEFDWNDANGGDTLSLFLSAIESNSAIVGDAFWELWPHDDEYGYVSSEKQFTLHYPGDSAAMRIGVQQLRMHAYKMRSLQVPIDSVPGSPEINVVIRSGTNDVLVWRGTAVAASYTIERSTSGVTGPWTVICDKCATDTSTPWMDMTTPAGALWYKVTAYNLAGVAGKPSSPYEVMEGNIIIDNLKDWSKVFAHSNNLSFDTTDSQYMNGDSSTVVRTAATNEFITWKQNDMKSFQAIAYFWPHEAISPFIIYTSINGRDWKLSQSSISKLYGNWLEYIYTLNGMSKVNYVKMVWNKTDGQIWSPQLGEITLTY